MIFTCRLILTFVSLQTGSLKPIIISTELWTNVHRNIKYDNFCISFSTNPTLSDSEPIRIFASFHFYLQQHLSLPKQNILTALQRLQDYIEKHSGDFNSYNASSHHSERLTVVVSSREFSSSFSLFSSTQPKRLPSLLLLFESLPWFS